MHITLYRKYRPKDFSEMAGETEIVTTLKNSLKNNKMAHAYLFAGPRGVGKTTSARLIAKGVNCLENGITDEPCNRCENCLSINEGNFMDLIEIDAASNRGIDEIRQLKEKINYRPSKGRKKIYIIDEVHMLTKEAFNALLKTLEEPPEHVIFILATTEPDKILPTIISRCQRYDFKSLSYSEVKDKLTYILKCEETEIDEESLKLIYESSGGSMRDSISILERILITCFGENITFEKTEAILGLTPVKKIEEFLKIIEKNEVQEGITFLEKLWLDSINIELFFKDLAKYSKESIINNRLETEMGLKIIDTVYEVLNRFKFEEDKRLVGYVVLNNLLKKPEVYREKVYEKSEAEIVLEKKVDMEQRDKNISKQVSLEEIKQFWTEILKEAKKEKITLGAFLVGAKPIKVSEGILYIGFEYENSFSKEQMELDSYNSTFLDVVRRITNSQISIKYEILNRKSVKKEEDDLAKKIIDFFGGEII